MELNEYVKHMHSLVDQFEEYWKHGMKVTVDNVFPQQLPIESWDEQFDFFVELPTDD